MFHRYKLRRPGLATENANPTSASSTKHNWLIGIGFGLLVVVVMLVVYFLFIANQRQSLIDRCQHSAEVLGAWNILRVVPFISGGVLLALVRL
jgi:hypothetical protein